MSLKILSKKQTEVVDRLLRARCRTTSVQAISLLYTFTGVQAKMQKNHISNVIIKPLVRRNILIPLPSENHIYFFNTSALVMKTSCKASLWICDPSLFSSEDNEAFLFHCLHGDAVRASREECELSSLIDEVASCT